MNQMQTGTKLDYTYIVFRFTYSTVTIGETVQNDIGHGNLAFIYKYTENTVKLAATGITDCKDVFAIYRRLTVREFFGNLSH